jgi:hypothetical protein
LAVDNQPFDCLLVFLWMWYSLNFLPSLCSFPRVSYLCPWYSLGWWFLSLSVLYMIECPLPGTLCFQVLKFEYNSGLIKPRIAAPTPRVSGSVGLGWSEQCTFLASFQVMLMFLVRGACIENLCPIWMLLRQFKRRKTTSMTVGGEEVKLHWLWINLDGGGQGGGFVPIGFLLKNSLLMTCRSFQAGF